MIPTVYLDLSDLIKLGTISYPHWKSVSKGLTNLHLKVRLICQDEENPYSEIYFRRYFRRLEVLNYAFFLDKRIVPIDEGFPEYKKLFSQYKNSLQTLLIESELIAKVENEYCSMIKTFPNIENIVLNLSTEKRGDFNLLLVLNTLSSFSNLRRIHFDIASTKTLQNNTSQAICAIISKNESTLTEISLKFPKNYPTESGMAIINQLEKCKHLNRLKLILTQDKEQLLSEFSALSKKIKNLPIEVLILDLHDKRFARSENSEFAKILVSLLHISALRKLHFLMPREKPIFQLNNIILENVSLIPSTQLEALEMSFLLRKNISFVQKLIKNFDGLVYFDLRLENSDNKKLTPDEVKQLVSPLPSFEYLKCLHLQISPLESDANVPILKLIKSLYWITELSIDVSPCPKRAILYSYGEYIGNHRNLKIVHLNFHHLISDEHVVAAVMKEIQMQNPRLEKLSYKKFYWSPLVNEQVDAVSYEKDLGARPLSRLFPYTEYIF